MCGKLILAKLGNLPHNNSCPKARAQGASKRLARPNGDRMELAMSNAQNYNKALAQSHTDKYNTTKTRVLATGVELSDEAFDALYRAAVGTSGLIGNAPTEISDAHADALDMLVAFLMQTVMNGSRSPICAVVRALSKLARFAIGTATPIPRLIIKTRATFLKSSSTV